MVDSWHLKLITFKQLSIQYPTYTFMFYGFCILETLLIIYAMTYSYKFYKPKIKHYVGVSEFHIWYKNLLNMLDDARAEIKTHNETICTFTILPLCIFSFLLHCSFFDNSSSLFPIFRGLCTFRQLSALFFFELVFIILRHCLNCLSSSNKGGWPSSISLFFIDLKVYYILALRVIWWFALSVGCCINYVFYSAVYESLLPINFYNIICNILLVDHSSLYNICMLLFILSIIALRLIFLSLSIWLFYRAWYISLHQLRFLIKRKYW